MDSLLSKYKGREDRLALVIEEKYKNAPLAKTRGKGKAAWAGKGTRATEPDGEADQDGDEAEDVDSDVTDSDVEREEGELCDWDRVYPLPAEVRASWKSHPKCVHRGAAPRAPLLPLLLLLLLTPRFSGT